MGNPFVLPLPPPFQGEAQTSFATDATAHADRSQWLRRVKLVAADNAGEGLDLSLLHIQFTVTSATIQTLRSLQLRIFNLMPEHAKLIQDEYTQVTLSVGYQGRGSTTAPHSTAGLTGTFEKEPPLTTIFSGTITYVRRGREDAKTTFVDIEAAEGDAAYNWSWVNSSLAAAWTNDQQRQTLLKELKKFQITEGTRTQFDLNPMPRGAVMYGATRDQIREFAKATGSEWHIEDDQLHLVPYDGWLGSDAIECNSDTGMVGSPEQTPDGLNIRMLLNGSLKTGYLIHVKSADITTTVQDANAPLINRTGEPLYMPDLSKTGHYKIYHVAHFGGTRNTPWYSDLVCRAIDPTNGRDIRSDLWTNSLVNGE